MSASTDFNGDFWTTTTNPYYQSLRFNHHQYFNENTTQKQLPSQSNTNYDQEASLMGNYEGHNVGYPLFGGMNEPPQYNTIKNEPTYNNTCRFNTNQSYSSPEMDNSISPPPTTSPIQQQPPLQHHQHNFVHNLNQFDSCIRQPYGSLVATKTLSPNGYAEKLHSTNNKCNNDVDSDGGGDGGSTSVKQDDSPALRALLTAKTGKKITYDYLNLQNNAVYQKLPYDKTSELNSAQQIAEKSNTTAVDDSGDNLSNVPVNFYPWMKTTHGINQFFTYKNF